LTLWPLVCSDLNMALVPPRYRSTGGLAKCQPGRIGPLWDPHVDSRGLVVMDVVQGMTFWQRLVQSWPVSCFRRKCSVWVRLVVLLTY